MSNVSTQILQGRAEFERYLADAPAETPVSIALLDLDNFKGINDDYGHAAGDEVLRSLERTLIGSLPRDALIARMGGDEYAVALYDTPAESLLILMEEVRSHFSSHEPGPNVPRKVHMSVGIANRPAHAKTDTDLHRAAYDALFRAKGEGRGRVAIYIEAKMTLKSNYYSRASLERLAKLSTALSRTEASLLREALDDLLSKHSEAL